MSDTTHKENVSSSHAATSPHASGERHHGLGDLLGPNSFMKGEFTGEEDLLVQGRVEGGITLKTGTLKIAPSAQIKANLRARVIVIEGEVSGDVIATEKVILEATGKIRGKVVTGALQIASGGVLNGSVEVQPKAGSGHVLRAA